MSNLKFFSLYIPYNVSINPEKYNINKFINFENILPIKKYDNAPKPQCNLNPKNKKYI